MEQELVSIITPIYNGEKFIEETIISVKKQTYTNWEMIIVDDCSKDNSEKIIKKLAESDERIKYFRLDKNSGVANARNTALKISKGRFAAFLDADDLWLPEKLEKQIDFMLEHNIEISFASYELIDEKGIKKNKVIRVPEKINYEKLLKENVIGCLTVVIDKSKVNFFEMPNIRHEDYITWLSLLKKGYKAYGIYEVLALYRKLDTSVSSNKLKSAKWRWDIYRNVEKLSLTQSLYYFLHYSIKGILKHT